MRGAAMIRALGITAMVGRDFEAGLASMKSLTEG